MKRLDLDKSPPAVQQLVRSLVRHPEVVEFEANGRVLLRILPAPQLTTEQRTALLKEARELVRRARQRNKDLPAHVIDREVRQAVRAVRRKQR